MACEHATDRSAQHGEVRDEPVAKSRSPGLLGVDCGMMRRDDSRASGTLPDELQTRARLHACRAG
ncbi:hypothetical protein BSLA_03r0862 [Burkholderia stabilis]|nr:hypothetical protein BSLA_03r0862 [Burkholderia stabilis]